MRIDTHCTDSLIVRLLARLIAQLSILTEEFMFTLICRHLSSQVFGNFHSRGFVFKNHRKQPSNLLRRFLRIRCLLFATVGMSFSCSPHLVCLLCIVRRSLFSSTFNICTFLTFSYTWRFAGANHRFLSAHFSILSQSYCPRCSSRDPTLETGRLICTPFW
jgi:hypothetical protein